MIDGLTDIIDRQTVKILEGIENWRWYFALSFLYIGRRQKRKKTNDDL